PEPELAALLERAEPRLVIADAQFEAQLPRACERLVSRDPVVTDDAFASLLAEAPLADPPPVAEDDPFLMLFTSGTTGLPKGALITHTNAIHSALTYSLYFRTGPDSSTAILMP